MSVYRVDTGRAWCDYPTLDEAKDGALEMLGAQEPTDRIRFRCLRPRLEWSIDDDTIEEQLGSIRFVWDRIPQAVRP